MRSVHVGEAEIFSCYQTWNEARREAYPNGMHFAYFTCITAFMGYGFQHLDIEVAHWTMATGTTPATGKLVMND